jgi:hypothetical protein
LSGPNSSAFKPHAFSPKWKRRFSDRITGPSG